MKTEHAKNFEGTCSHLYSDEMVELAMKELLELFSDGISFNPGELEDLFTGKFSLDCEFWRSTPFYPALFRLIDDGKIECYKDDEEIVWYKLHCGEGL